MKKYLLGAILIASCVFAHAQVGVGTNNPKATLDVNAMYKTGNESLVDGVLIPRVDRERASSMNEVVESTLIYIDNINTGDQEGQTQKVDAVGFYYFKIVGTDKYWEKLNIAYAKPEFFYMPSVLLPTLSTDSRLADTTSGYKYNSTTGEYSVDLFKLFSEQFTSTVASSNENSSLDNFVLTANKYDYFITYVDKTVFNTGTSSENNPNTIKVDTNGILRYKILPDAIIKNGSFMNVVLKVK